MKATSGSCEFKECEELCSISLHPRETHGCRWNKIEDRVVAERSWKIEQLEEERVSVSIFERLRSRVVHLSQMQLKKWEKF